MEQTAFDPTIEGLGSGCTVTATESQLDQQPALVLALNLYFPEMGAVQVEAELLVLVPQLVPCQ